METAKIRVESGIKISVNDDGDYIVANVNDNAFVEKFYKLVEKTEELSKQLENVKTDEIEETRKYIEVVKESTQKIMDEIDVLFGPDACSKIFGKNVSPSGYAIADFFEQLIPIFQSYAVKRKQKISEKYSKDRRFRNASKKKGNKQ